MFDSKCVSEYVILKKRNSCQGTENLIYITLAALLKMYLSLLKDLASILKVRVLKHQMVRKAPPSFKLFDCNTVSNLFWYWWFYIIACWCCRTSGLRELFWSFLPKFQSDILNHADKTFGVKLSSFLLCSSQIHIADSINIQHL